MGILSKIIVNIAAKKAEEVITEKVTEEIQEKNKKPKKKLFKSRQELGEALLGYVGISQAIAIVASLFVGMESDFHGGAFYSTYAMAILLSCGLFLLGLIVYGLYLIDLWPILIMVVAPLPFFLIPVFIEYGFANSFKFFLSGEWMGSVTKLVFSLLGIFITVGSIAIACYNESKGTKKKTKKQEPSTISDEEAEKNRSLLRTAIQDNAIRVQFTRRQWGFTASSKVLFGYDDENEQFVFVSDNSSNTIAGEMGIFLDYEDILYASDGSTTEYQRVIKLYYLGKSKEECIVTMLQKSLDDMCDNRINKIKQYANKYPTDEHEIEFRRKIRHLASSLEVDFYPNRPFLNDKWFELLKATMEKIKNNNTNGYSLFRNKLIANEDYWGDDTLFTIIEDLSKNPPDPSSAKKEAKRLCFRDFGATIGHSIKNLFSDNE